MSPCRLLLLSWMSAFCMLAVQPLRADELTEVQRLQASGQSAAALQRADAYLAAHPKDASMRFAKGVLLAESERRAEAIEVFERLSEEFPELAEPYNNLAALHAATGDYDRARSVLEQALRANPRLGAAQQNLGDVHAALAARAYARALELEPGNPVLPSKLALARQLISTPLPR